MNSSIILRKEYQKARQRVLYHIRKGKIRAEIEEDERIEKIARSLRKKVDFKRWRNHETFAPHTRKIIEAIFKEFGPLSEDAIYRYSRAVLVSGGLLILQEQKEIEVSRDSYGRKQYRKPRPPKTRPGPEIPHYTQIFP